MNFSRFFKAHEVLNKILKNQDDTIRNSILVTWYSLMELPYSFRENVIVRGARTEVCRWITSLASGSSRWGPRMRWSYGAHGIHHPSATNCGKMVRNSVRVSQNGTIGPCPSVRSKK